MPPKIKITRDDIIKTGIELIRKNGEEAINARAIASSLNCSTQPVFSNFSTMEELQSGIRKSVYGIYLDFIKREEEKGEYPRYKSFGMAYILFAKEEKELFKLLFMCDRKEQKFVPTQDFEESVNMIMNLHGASREKAELFHLEMWTCTHGIATMFATSFIALDKEIISTVLSDVYQGLLIKHFSEVNCDGNQN